MIAHVCVAIQLLGAPAAPDAVQALQRRCDGILGAGECRLTGNGAPDGANVPGGAGNACWRATVARTADDAAANVLVSAPGAPAGRGAQRDLTFQSRDERADRWATLGLVIAALVTLEEHSAGASTRPAPTPIAATPPSAGSSWFFRDRSGQVDISAQPEEPSHAPLNLADLRLLGVADIGRLPWATVGARLAATFGLVRVLDLELGGAYLTSTGTGAIPVADGGAGGAHFSLWSMTLGLCGKSLVVRRLSGHTCVGGDVGVTTASGFGIAEPARKTVWVPNAWFGFDSALRLTHHLALVAEFKGEVAVARPVFVINNASPVFQPSRFSENVALGVAATF